MPLYFFVQDDEIDYGALLAYYGYADMRSLPKGTSTRRRPDFGVSSARSTSPLNAVRVLPGNGARILTYGPRFIFNSFPFKQRTHPSVLHADTHNEAAAKAGPSGGRLYSRAYWPRDGAPLAPGSLQLTSVRLAMNKRYEKREVTK